MPRALASTITFASQYPQHKSFFDSFMSFTSTEETVRHTIQMRATYDHTPYMVLKTLNQLKEVCFQDLSFYKSKWPGLRLWTSLHFTQHSQALDAWISYVKSFEEEIPTQEQIGVESGVQRHDFLLLREEVRTILHKLDTLALPKHDTFQAEKPSQEETTNERLSVNTLRILNGT